MNNEAIKREPGDEVRHQSERQWSGLTATLAGLLTTLLLGSIFIITAYALTELLPPVSSIWLPEAEAFIGSVDTRGQRWGFLIAAAVFALIIAAIVLVRPKTPARLEHWGNQLCDRVDRWLRLDALARFFAQNERNSIGRAILLSCFVIALAVFAWGQSKGSFYTGRDLVRITSSDPHIYSVFGKQGEILAGRFDQATTEPAAYYGVGPSLIYTSGRLLGASPGYSYAYQLARWSNLLVVLVLLWGILDWRGPRPFVIPSIAVAALATTIAILLLLPNSFGVFAPNIAGMRYLPLVLFIVAAKCSPQRSTWLSTTCLGVSAALGFVYSTDVGLFCLVGYLAFVGLEDGTLREKLLRAITFLSTALAAALVLDVIVGELTSLSVIHTLLFAISAESGGYGGILVEFSRFHATIIALFIVTTVALVLESTSRALTLEERFVGAISVFGFFWYYYYLHRPSNLYWIYMYLALFNIRYILTRTVTSSTAAQRVGGILTLVALGIILQQNFKEIRRSFLMEERTAYRESSGPQTLVSGTSVAPSFGDPLNSRIAVLNQNLTPDSIVVTAFPYLVSTETSIVVPPHDIIFSLPTSTDIERLVKDILARRPARVFLEPNNTQGWGPEVTKVVVSRIESAIAGQYKRDESIEGWRVWTPTAQ